MIIKISDYFKISIDELLKNDVQTVKKLIMTKKKLEKHETYKSNKTKETSMSIANGYFSVPKDEKPDIQVKGAADNCKLHIIIADKDDKIYYLLDGQELNDLQTLYFEKGSYIIQIAADDYTEDIISLNYNIKIEN